MAGGSLLKSFSAAAALQDFLLQEAGPGVLTLVPHQRLARQVWRRQRQRCLEQGLSAWEPLPLATLGHWQADLSQSLWLPEAPASPLQRLVFWQRAFEAGPSLEGLAPDLAWAQALDEAYALLCRHRLLSPEPDAHDSPLIAWRRRVMGIYQEISREEGCLTAAALPGHLLRGLDAGQLNLPEKLLVVGLETPAPVEDAWLQAVARRVPVLHLQVRGHPQAVQQAVVLPDKRQELEWAGARLVELAHQGIPLHRLALTSPDLAGYLPELRRLLAELLGPPQTDGGGAYNFSQGPTLAETPLWQAALLPLKFAGGGELREDLISLLLSPYYRFQAQHPQLPLWDRAFREHRVERGWEFLSRVAVRADPGENAGEVLTVLDRVWQRLRPAPAGGPEWAARLTQVWQLLGFPQGLEETETAQWPRLGQLLQDLAGTLAAESLTAAQFREWLTLGAREVLLPGEGSQDAGIQVLGLLEMRGLDFDQALCLGLNSGVFPPPPRPLPLLSAGERQKILGGTYQSQHLFAREAFEALLAAAPKITLTRARLVEQEECVATSMFLGEWQDEKISPLSRPHPAWLRSPGVRAAFAPAAGPIPPEETGDAVAIPIPPEVSLTQAQTALACPCRFLLEVLLAIRELPEIEAGLSPQERGDRLHKVLARFAGDFKKILDEQNYWGEEQAEQARELLLAAACRLLEDRLGDLHWQAEWDRWLGEEGLLWEWLRLERERYHQGWRWLAMEERFADLAGPGWPFKLKGRIDRIDYHRDQGLILWDYKTGEVPKAQKVFDDLEEFQLPGYLAAVKKGRVPAAPGEAALKAGYIGMKSAREKHLQHEDFPKRAGAWGQVVAAWEARLAALGRRLAAGDFRPQPAPAPQGKNEGACQYCPHLLICGYQIPESPEGEEEGE
ncbi:MAG: PD-(D/E)XK nuclease family protein [Desulfobaccales bacterium]